MNNILHAIGNTPLVKLNHIPDQAGAAVYVKLEYFNPTASYKDRMALSVIEEAEKRNDLKPGMTVIENTAGSTGTSLAFVCAAKRYRFKAISSDAFSKEKLRAIQLFGAELELIENGNAGITADLIPRMIAHVREMSKQDGFYWTKQFENPDVLTGYSKMGCEIIAQIGKPIHTFCAAVGTAGMFVGVSKELKKSNSETRIIALEPASAPLLTKGVKGTHNVEGIAPGFVPPFLQHLRYDEAKAIEEHEARLMAKRLVKEEGIFAGLSTGLNIAAAVEMAKALSPYDVVVTVACDSGLKYLSTGLYS
jgi:cysteine synthase A